jgi:hypothetical protein
MAYRAYVVSRPTEGTLANSSALVRLSGRWIPTEHYGGQLSVRRGAYEDLHMASNIGYYNRVSTAAGVHAGSLDAAMSAGLNGRQTATVVAKIASTRRMNGEVGELQPLTIRGWVEQRVRLSTWDMAIAVMSGLVLDAPDLLGNCFNTLDVVTHILEETAQRHLDNVLGEDTTPAIPKVGVAHTPEQSNRSAMIMRSRARQAITAHNNHNDAEHIVHSTGTNSPTNSCSRSDVPHNVEDEEDKNDRHISLESGQSKRVCIQCQESSGEDVQFIFIPCMHRCLCGDCVKTYQASVYGKKCPVCNAAADNIIQTF